MLKIQIDPAARAGGPRVRGGAPRRLLLCCEAPRCLLAENASWSRSADRRGCAAPAPRRFARKDLSEAGIGLFCFALQPTGIRELAERGRPGCCCGSGQGDRAGCARGRGSVYLAAPALLRASPAPPGPARPVHTQQLQPQGAPGSPNLLAPLDATGEALARTRGEPLDLSCPLPPGKIKTSSSKESYPPLFLKAVSPSTEGSG